MTTRGGKTTRDPPYPNNAARITKGAVSEESDEEEEAKSPQQNKKMAPHEFFDTTLLPFPWRNRKPTVDEQFGNFVEVIKKLYVNIPLLEAMQVPTYAKYLKDILNNKRKR